MSSTTGAPATGQLSAASKLQEQVKTSENTQAQASSGSRHFLSGWLSSLVGGREGTTAQSQSPTTDAAHSSVDFSVGKATDKETPNELQSSLLLPELRLDTNKSSSKEQPNEVKERNARALSSVERKIKIATAKQTTKTEPEAAETAPKVKRSRRAAAKEKKKTIKADKASKDSTEDKKEKPTSKPAKRRASAKEDAGTSLNPSDLPFDALSIDQPPVPRLAHNLDRVLFNRGVYNLQDRHSGGYNFDPYLEHVMPATEFNFDAIAAYKTSSEDKFLAQTAADHDLKYVGSTSSMTSMLTHFHYLISHWRELDFSMLSRGFKISDSKNSRNFTEIYRAPQAIFLRYKDGTYAIDADMEYSTPNVLMALGQSLEKLLTLPADVFERFRRSDPRGVPEEEMDAPQSFHYSKQGKILMRSQLDAYDPRLPGSGVFDLKTRAVLPIRMSSREFQDLTGYQIMSEMGTYESYEREFYDMFRSTLLKYSLQVRMGRMEGIFIDSHNVEEIFGFQFMTLSEMDRVLHGQEHPCLGDQEFRASLAIVHDILDQATTEFPEKSIRLHFDTRPGVVPMMYIFAAPMEDAQIAELQDSTKDAMAAFERELRGLPELPASQTPASSSRPDQPAAPKDLLAWTLTTTSRVNKTRVPRPESLGPNDKWELKYELSRVTDAAKAQSWYASTKTRRQKALDWSDEVDDAQEKKSEGQTLEQAMKAAPTQPVKKKRGLAPSYMAMLRELAQRGRAVREQRLKERTGEKVVVGLDGLGHTPGQKPGWASEKE